MRRSVALVLVCVCCGCKSAPDPTETIVVVDADAVVRGLAKRLRAHVESVSDDHALEERNVTARWPASVAVVPFHGDATREFRLSLDVLREDGAVFVSARVRAGFVRDRKRYVHVRLTEACLQRECDQDSTCQAGECVSARVPSTALCESDDCPATSGQKRAASAGSGAKPAARDCAQGELPCGEQCVARDSVEHCGACDHDCSGLPNLRAPARCEADRCVFDAAACMAGHGDCNGDPDDGCETELSDSAHCGACDVACAPDTQLCAAKPEGHACVPNCPADKPVSCDDTCVDINTSVQNCGKCGALCRSGMRCEAGQCKPVCPTGQLACGDVCVDGMRDDQHCGSCGVACGKDRICQDGSCVSCVQGAACEISECRRGVTQCASGPMCKDEGPVSDGTACGDGASCAGGLCACGMSNGPNRPFESCELDPRCESGYVCVDRAHNGYFFCKPLCNTDADCEPHRKSYPDLRCSAALCSNGKNPGVGVCVEEDSMLAPAYDASACCGATGAGDASVNGCADGTREAFTDLAQFPAIAGCEAKWPLASLRAPATGRACGNSMGVDCSVPADACGVGWHVCAAPPYGATDLSEKVSVEQCAGQPGKYAAAVGDRACEVCNEQAYGAACCGTACIQGNASCVFPQATAWFGSVNGRLGLCGGLVAAHPNQGVLCCRGF